MVNKSAAIGVNPHGQKVIYAKQARVRVLVEHGLVFDTVAPSDDECSGEVVHAGVDDGVSVLAGRDPERAGEIGFPGPGGGGDDHVECLASPVVGGIALHSHFRDPTSFPVINLRDRCCWEWEPGLLDHRVDPVLASELERVSRRGEKELLGGELIVCFVSDEVFKPGSQMDDSKFSKFVVIDCGEHVIHPGSVRAHGNSQRHECRRNQVLGQCDPHARGLVRTRVCDSMPQALAPRASSRLCRWRPSTVSGW